MILLSLIKRKATNVVCWDGTGLRPHGGLLIAGLALQQRRGILCNPVKGVAQSSHGEGLEDISNEQFMRSRQSHLASRWWPRTRTIGHFSACGIPHPENRSAVNEFVE